MEHSRQPANSAAEVAEGLCEPLPRVSINAAVFLL